MTLSTNGRKDENLLTCFAWYTNTSNQKSQSRDEQCNFRSITR